VLGDSNDWDVKTELSASTVDMLQVLARALGVDFEITPVKRPKTLMDEVEAPREAEKAIPASSIMSFLEGAL